MREIPLTKGKVAIVDDEDYGRIAAHKWYCLRGKYAARSDPDRNKSAIMIFMHHEVMGKNNGGVVHHRDGNGLNNTRSNLCYRTFRQNQQAQRPQRKGASKYKGVHWSKCASKWIAKIIVCGNAVHIGCYVVEEEAARAYDAAARKHFGEFAYLNFEEVST